MNKDYEKIDKKELAKQMIEEKLRKEKKYEL